jgi:hypothetical protein
MLPAKQRTTTEAGKVTPAIRPQGLARHAAFAAVIGALCAFPALADPPVRSKEVKVADAGPQVYPDFTFKRIGVPQKDVKKRITVQIDPAEQARMLAAVMAPPENPVPKGGRAEGLMPEPGPVASNYDWYWEKVSPALGARDGRFPTALSALTQGPEGTIVAAPRMQHMQDIAEAHGADILEATIGTEVSPALVLAVMATESAGRIDAVSSAGAVGLMQLIPATAERFGVKDSTDPEDNIKGGVAYLNWLMREFDSDPLMVLAAYNAGENAVKDNGGVPPYAETRDYVPKVLAAWAIARGLCVTPPELVTDGCVFTVGRG